MSTRITLSDLEFMTKSEKFAPLEFVPIKNINLHNL